ncbi:E3 ubiquitin-protein ligase listerin isoform X1 [Juglans microcarpa x Juglans regia]|uniref:E3 ubiquitin-protein ligase listerin isoform X1 n=2 Tax=Juglans microcarpa x Juglans regia TaxID=2249226 RepID=UPI001B7E8EA5|nr:E3 ubiquitin-protein ligase listerin isoform X1 [Juglans microcarpa x Juglans regia]XP_040991884.1 E3 ubiquitin-protein ligase listerin isoform X1 [Juglans microcarpa x Juglans regia]
MGRQKGEGGKGKGRASSSSLAASLLPAGSTAAVGFGGYVGGSRLDSSLASDEASSFVDMDGEVAQHLKRLGRKDPVTKLKALASLSVLFKEKPGKDIVSIIPQWAFEYKRLLQDYNREVRRATHDTMTNLVVAVGRDLAPHLKSLMGPWWFSQFDPVSEVSQAAKRSLQAAFQAQEKRLDALMLCTNEIFMYLEENLKLTPQNMSDKAVALDELKEMHQQVIYASLLALATLLDVLICVQLERPGFENLTVEPKHASKARATAISSAENLFTAHKYFVDFLKSQSPAIRSAAFSVLRSFIKNIPQAFNEVNIKTISGMILGAFQEKDPVCHSSMWDAVLLFSRRFPDSWTSLNVQKVVCSRLWYFLRNGCFGSYQVSYPALVPFLDTVPPKAIEGEKFFLDFFQNLWAGRNPFHSSNANRVAFFQAFKECFLWGLRNASRYCEGVDSIHHFQVNLIDNILVKLLWQDYMFLVSLKTSEGVLSGTSAASSEKSNLPSNKKTAETSNIKYPVSYLRDLGKCIIEILSGISLMEHDLLSTFTVEFKENCLGMLQQTENTERSTESVEQIIHFILLLEEHAVHRDENWPLVDLVGPMLAQSFPLITSLDSPECVRLLSVSVSVFGPRKILQELFIHNKGHSSSLSGDRGRQLNEEQFIQMFREIFVPWCMHEDNSSTSARLDLLLALLDDECFSEQWGTVITHVTNLEHSGTVPAYRGSNRIAMLAMLLEKARDKITRKVGEDSYSQKGAKMDQWHHDDLEIAAVTIASSLPPFRTSDAQFVRAVLGGSKEGDATPFVSRNTLILIFEEVFRKLLSFILESSLTWVRDAGFLLAAREMNFGMELESSSSMYEMGQFALEVLDGSFFCLKTLDEENGLLQRISAAIFIIDWEFSIRTAIDDAIDEKLNKNIVARLNFGESVHAFHCKRSNQFWKSLSIHSRGRLGSILIQCIRSAIFSEDRLDADNITSLCCLWMLEVLECFCQDQDEEQNLLDQLLSKGDIWPLWIRPDFNTPKGAAVLEIENVPSGIHASGSDKFVSFVNKLILKIGIDRVIGLGKHTPSPKEAAYEQVTSRPWLVAEMLCTWKWPGGSAIASFLPLLSSYVKSRSYGFQESLLDSVFNILLHGALVHGGRSAHSFSYVWPASGDGVKDIKEPFLRALVSFLYTLFKDDIWETQKVKTLFEFLVNKLFIGEAININCLRILPPLVNILVRALCQNGIGSGESSMDARLDSPKENHMQDALEGWLQRTLLFPPLVSWKIEEDMEDWFELVISCYPLSASGGIQALKQERNISTVERSLLLALFRKQRHGASASSAANQQPVVQMLLSKLMVISVGYCWKEFDEDDWEFLLSNLRRWIQSAVVVMEEVAENLNDAFVDMSSSDNLDIKLKKLKQIVLVSNSSPIDIATNALLSFSLFSGHLLHQQSEDLNNINPLRTERWDPIRDRILEGILRLFFCTGIAEAIASCCCHQAASIVASHRLEHRYFWELIASSVANSSPHVRDKAVKSVEFWGLSKGPISSLYAILFSSNPVYSLQFAAYFMLSTEPVSNLAITGEGPAMCLDSDSTVDQDPRNPDLSSKQNIHLREEISCMIEKLPYEVLEMDLVAQKRVNVFLAWSLLLSHLWSLPSSSPGKDRLVQYIQDSVSSVILDCIFQNIPVELCMTHSLKKKDTELPAGISEVASAATRAITMGSLLCSMESLWPVEEVKVASLGGAIFGVMLCVLPAYVRGWFSDLRDRSVSSAIESFTRSWCSPPLIANELSQIKKAKFADENFSVSVSKSANEVVATYTKDETGMDLVIRLPASYPLRPVDVDCTKSLGISEVKQRKWLMSMMSFVRNQNGALAEAIGIWKRNFDKEFEGVEECPICYSVIHTTNHSLPRLACKTCKHKFHSACLYKWFSTSHKSSCPLCQSPF